MSEIPHFAPGCFGSALAFQGDHPVCAGCAFKQQCEPVHRANLNRMRAQLGIEQKPDKPVLTAKMVEILKRIQKDAPDFADRLVRGDNPFSIDCMRFMYLAARVLIGIQAPIKSETLAELYTSRLGCQQKTAMFYAQCALRIFMHVGAVQEVDGAFVLRRN